MIILQSHTRFGNKRMPEFVGRPFFCIFATQRVKPSQLLRIPNLWSIETIKKYKKQVLVALAFFYSNSFPYIAISLRIQPFP